MVYNAPYNDQLRNECPLKKAGGEYMKVQMDIKDTNVINCECQQKPTRITCACII